MRVNRLFFLLSSYRPSLLSPQSARRSEATPPRAGAALEATSEAWLARMAVRHAACVECGVRTVRGLSVRAHGRARCALCAVVSFSFVRRHLLASFRAPAGGREARAWCVICTTRRHGTRA